MRFKKEELKLLEDGLGWLLDQTNDESWNGNMKWKKAEKLRNRIMEELK